MIFIQKSKPSLIDFFISIFECSKFDKRFQTSIYKAKNVAYSLNYSFLKLFRPLRVPKVCDGNCYTLQKVTLALFAGIVSCEVTGCDFCS